MDKARACPSCKIDVPVDMQRCYCGYDFPTGTMQISLADAPVGVPQENQELPKSAATKKFRFGRPIVRYPIAFLIVILGYVVALNNPGTFSVFLVALAISLILMYELIALTLIGLVAYGVFGIVAALPVSVAIIIGACIIAGRDRR